MEKRIYDLMVMIKDPWGSDEEFRLGLQLGDDEVVLSDFWDVPVSWSHNDELIDTAYEKFMNGEEIWLEPLIRILNKGHLTPNGLHTLAYILSQSDRDDLNSTTVKFIEPLVCRLLADLPTNCHVNWYLHDNRPFLSLVHILISIFLRNKNYPKARKLLSRFQKIETQNNSEVIIFDIILSAIHSQKKTLRLVDKLSERNPVLGYLKAKVQFELGDVLGAYRTLRLAHFAVPYGLDWVLGKAIVFPTPYFMGSNFQDERCIEVLEDMPDPIENWDEETLLFFNWFSYHWEAIADRSIWAKAAKFRTDGIASNSIGDSSETNPRIASKNLLQQHLVSIEKDLSTPISFVRTTRRGLEVPVWSPQY